MTKDLATLLMDISRLYTSGKKSIVERYKEVKDYDGTAEATIIYKLDYNNQMINTEYEHFILAIANPETEENPFNYQKAYLIEGEIPNKTNKENKDRVILISCINPVTTLKTKFRAFDNNRFKSIDEKVLNLRTSFDVVIINDSVYLLTMAGESFFHMEHAYKGVCEKTVEELIESEIFSSPIVFKEIATSKHNPRRFVSYDQKNFEFLKHKENRKQISDIFHIKLTKDGIFDTTTETNNDKIVKILCNKGMIHPISDSPVEVNGTKPWPLR